MSEPCQKYSQFKEENKDFIAIVYIQAVYI